MAPKSVNLPMRKAKGLDGRAKALIAGGVIALVVIVGLCVWFFGLRGYFAAQNAEPVFVSSVSSITGVMSDLDPRYSGLVEPQQVTKVNKDESRTVADMLVQEGDPVTIGQPLFSYDTGETDLAIRQAELELEGIANELTVLQDSKAQLEKEQKDASKDEQFSYTVQIQSTKLQIKSKEYDRSVKQSELEKLQNALTNNQVLSEVDGVVQEINLTPATDSQGNPLPFISILSSGEFRIKGTITEMNINSISEGQAVTVRSRVDPSSRWTGAISSIEYEPVQDNNNMYYGGMNSGEKASKYNFYVTLDAPEGLILGQHVYIEPLAAAASRKGMWLPEMYLFDISDDNTAGYVWARDEEEKLEKRPVMLGQYDSGEGLYEIVSGLAATDYIALPSEDLVEGGPTTMEGGNMDMPGGMTGDPGLDGSADGSFAVDPDGGLYEEGAVPIEGEDGSDGTVDGSPDGTVPDGDGTGGDTGDGTTDGTLPQDGARDVGGEEL